MPEFSRSTLRSFANLRENVIKAAHFSAANKLTATTSVFLSHSHHDKELARNAAEFLRCHGVTVYIDWLDEEMPTTISVATANKLRTKIEENRKFVVLATSNSLNSKWVPWELGFADGRIRLDRIAVMRILEDSGAYRGSEYVGLYPRIEQINSSWYVVTRPEIKLIRLEDWLKSP